LIEPREIVLNFFLQRSGFVKNNYRLSVDICHVIMRVFINTEMNS